MTIIHRVLATLNENIGEGNRWSGRTHTSVSRSPELHRHPGHRDLAYRRVD